MVGRLSSFLVGGHFIFSGALAVSFREGDHFFCIKTTVKRSMVEAPPKWSAARITDSPWGEDRGKFFGGFSETTIHGNLRVLGGSSQLVSG